MKQTKKQNTGGSLRKATNTASFLSVIRTPPPLCSSVCFLFSLSRQLLVEFRHVIVPLGLIARASDRRGQLVLPAERGDLELPTAVSRAVSQKSFVTGELPWLLVHQPHVTMQTWRGFQTGITSPFAGTRFQHSRMPSFCRRGHLSTITLVRHCCHHNLTEHVSFTNTALNMQHACKGKKPCISM